MSGQPVPVFERETIGSVPAGILSDTDDDERLSLEACICGEHFECPDDWHWGEDLPCSCTPDCALDAPDLRGWTEAEARAAWGDR